MRQCGTCTLCCKLVPVRELGKRGGERCEYQRHGKGCAIYHQRPSSCRLWSCAWLIGKEPERDLSRPDRAGYVIDAMPDYILVTDTHTGNVTELPVIQIWVDKENAHRDPALRAWLDYKAKETGMGALARLAGNAGAIGLFAPSISSNGKWNEIPSRFKPEGEHTRADIERVLATRGLIMEAR